MASLKTWFVVVNPTSGNNSSKQGWPLIKQLLESNMFDFDYAFTQYAKHGSVIVQKAIQIGHRNIISIGGDGTLHNIVNGIMKQTEVPSACINVGVISIGTGNDWVKSHGISKDLKKAIQTIKNGRLKKQDVGKIILENHPENPVYFINLSGIGFDGHVVSKVDKYKRLGTFAYLIGTLFALFSFKNFNSRVTINSEEVFGKTLLVLIGLCTYSGGGMRLTKTPDPFDGLFDISIAKNFSKLDIIKNTFKLFNGKIVNYKKVVTLKTSSIEIQVGNNKSALIQADGELIGQGNMAITIIQKSFSFYNA
jgi:diacylglycerol kinase (ATP)